MDPLDWIMNLVEILKVIGLKNLKVEMHDEGKITNRKRIRL